MSEAQQWFDLAWRVFAPMVAGCLLVVALAVFALGYLAGRM